MSEQMTLHVTGITCTGCEQRAEAVLRRVEGVTEAAADHRTGQVTIEMANGQRVDREHVVARLAAAGFDPSEPTGEVAP